MEEKNRSFILGKLDNDPIFDNLKGIECYAEENHIPIMKKDTAKILSFLCALKRPQKILEIGTAIGYSGTILLNAYENSQLTTIEIDENNYFCAKNNFNNFNLSDRITMYLGDCMEILPLMEGKFDFIFIDGPKAQYMPIFQYCSKLINKNGIMVFDNILYSGYISGIKEEIRKHRTIINNMKSFIDCRLNDKNYINELLDVGDGLLILYKKD